MNFGFFFLFLIIQVIVNNVLSMFINTSNIFGLIAFYLLSCLIILWSDKLLWQSTLLLHLS